MLSDMIPVLIAAALAFGLAAICGHLRKKYP